MAHSPHSARESDTGLDVVTGAFSYSGSAIARVLLESGRSVRTLTGHPKRAQDDDRGIEVCPLSFDDPVKLTSSLEGATTLYNTYWVRFAHGRANHQVAVANSRTLFQAARSAGVGRIVHVSITNPSIDLPYPYFVGKAQVERALAECDVASSVVRPAILFGGRGVLLNNIAWLLRRVPIFGIAGSGHYRVRPVHVDDLADLCVRLATRGDNVTVDAIGPESPTFVELVTSIRSAVGSRARLVHLPPRLVTAAAQILGTFLHDVLLTSEELYAMMDGLAVVEGEPTGSTSLSSWISDHGSELGIRYLNELDLHFR